MMEMRRCFLGGWLAGLRRLGFSLKVILAFNARDTLLQIRVPLL